jgi:hypothetical protein
VRPAEDFPPPPDRCSSSGGVSMWLMEIADWLAAHDLPLSAKVVRAYVDSYVDLTARGTKVRGLRGEISHTK